MTNINKRSGKKELRKRLFRIAVKTLQDRGWSVERTKGGASVRVIKKDGVVHRVSIRTSQDQWIAFPRLPDDTGWATLGEVDVVIAVAVDEVHPATPGNALVHWFEGHDMRARFDRAYAARRAAGHTLPKARGIWVALYKDEDGTPTNVGGGAGNDPSSQLARVSLLDGDPEQAPLAGGISPSPRAQQAPASTSTDDRPLTIADAKRRLALTFGVSETNIKISVEA
jgi:hypothetical protein